MPSQQYTGKGYVKSKLVKRVWQWKRVVARQEHKRKFGLTFQWLINAKKRDSITKMIFREADQENKKRLKNIKRDYSTSTNFLEHTLSQTKSKIQATYNMNLCVSLKIYIDQRLLSLYKNLSHTWRKTTTFLHKNIRT